MNDKHESSRSRTTRERAHDDRNLGVCVHGDPCVLKQSPSSKMRKSRFFSMNVQPVSKRHWNHWATSAPGLVITVRVSALPESDCTLTSSLIDDKYSRSVDFDGAVHRCAWNFDDCSQLPHLLLLVW